MCRLVCFGLTRSVTMRMKDDSGPLRLHRNATTQTLGDPTKRHSAAHESSPSILRRSSIAYAAVIVVGVVLCFTLSCCDLVCQRATRICTPPLLPSRLVGPPSEGRHAHRPSAPSMDCVLLSCGACGLCVEEWNRHGQSRLLFRFSFFFFTSSSHARVDGRTRGTRWTYAGGGAHICMCLGPAQQLHVVRCGLDACELDQLSGNKVRHAQRRVVMTTSLALCPARMS